MRKTRIVSRWATVVAAAGALVLLSGTGAQAAQPMESRGQADVRSSGDVRSSEGVQGINFCLLSRCDVEGGGLLGGGTQGTNLCLLSLCSVRS